MNATLQGILLIGFTVATTACIADDLPTNPTTEVAVNDTLPTFSLENDQGNNWDVADYVGKKILVLYFYPGDFTGGCNKQAQAYREKLSMLEGLDVELVGISGDSAATHRLFKESHKLQHTLLSDSDGCLASLLGIQSTPGSKVRARNLDGKVIMNDNDRSLIIERKLTLPRITFIVDRSGKVVSRRNNVDPATDADEVRKIVAKLSK
jgi:peroxiredoxin Q/BCP